MIRCERNNLHLHSGQPEDFPLSKMPNITSSQSISKKIDFLLIRWKNNGKHHEEIVYLPFASIENTGRKQNLRNTM